ncbi:MAG: pyridoxine 5'-phosphate synthase [bacterium]|nr:pyridoxine 5'-phosphate synthase [bacterium]
MAGLGVNIDHVATVRQARQTVEPDPVWAACEAQLAGADCITFHLRKDRRHICDRDARVLTETVTCKLNMEMSLDPEIVEIAISLAPQQATLVPENRQEVTTEGGLDVIAHADRVKEVTDALHSAGISVSAFVDPVPEQILASRAAGCEAIEIHTGTYANACLGSSGSNPDPKEIASTLSEIETGLQAGIGAGLIVHAGHGLTYGNIAPVVSMEGFCEFNIGHSIIARAVFTGLRQAVAEMKSLLT